MKRVFNLRNQMGITLALISLLFMASSFTVGSAESAQLVGDHTQQKEQKVKVVVVVDGKETKIDTTFNLPDEAAINQKVDSMLTKLDVKGESGGKANRMVFRFDKSRKFNHENMTGTPPGNEQFDIRIQNEDSDKVNGKREIIRVKRFEKERMGGESDLLLPPPPMPPHSSFMRHQPFGGDPYAFDTRDESVVSYEKKDIGNGLERITIVRKKHEEHQNRKEITVKVEASDGAAIKKKGAEGKSSKKLTEKVETGNSVGVKKID